MIRFCMEIAKDSDDSLGTPKQKRIMTKQACQLAVHEVCHLFNMHHCIDFLCCLNGSGSVEEMCRQPIFLCPICLHKLKIINPKLDLLRRYQRMSAFFSSHELPDCAQWIDDRLKSVNKYLRIAYTYLKHQNSYTYKSRRSCVISGRTFRLPDFQRPICQLHSCALCMMKSLRERNRDL